MNIIVDKLSKIVGKRIKVPFNTNFKTGILFELMMTDNNLTNKQKVIGAIQLYYPNFNEITDYQKAFDDIIWFFSCGKEQKSTNSQGNSSNKQIYSYEYDAEYIYSAFLEQYGIDLQDIEYLHWWKFKAMFNSLKNDTKIVEIMGYRAIDLGKIKDKEEKTRYKKLKQIYKLPDMRTQEQKEADFGSAFW